MNGGARGMVFVTRVLFPPLEINDGRHRFDHEHTSTE
jgi:hypothetical protein